MIRSTRNLLAALFLAAIGAAIGAAPALAAPAPHWTIISTSSPTHFAPGDSSGHDSYVLTITNSGGAATNGSQITITDTLDSGLTADPTPSGGIVFEVVDDAFAEFPCDPGPPVTCTVTETVHPGARLYAFIPVDIDSGADGTTLTNQASVSGGGAADASATEQTPVTPDPAGFGFQSFDTSLTDSAGSPVTQAGSHPYLFHLGFQLNTNQLLHTTPAGTPRDIAAKLPAGLVVNPAATVRCTEAQLEGDTCPDASAIGVVHPTIGIFGYSTPDDTDPLYNMVPTPGAPATFGFDAAGLRIFTHLLGGLDSAGDYALTSDTRDILQDGQISGVSVELWGSPSDPGHDLRRGHCGHNDALGAACPVPATDIPFLTMPSACSGPLSAALSIDSWEDPGNFISGSAQTTDSDGNPVGVTGCSSLAFAPTLQARPTTTTADSPSGLDVDLHVPQTNSLSQPATANLKKAVVTLPEGLVVNPSSGNGLDACSSSQIGLTTPVGQAPIHFTAAPAGCPDAAKIGTVEVDTPLLDAPLPGAVYIAKPHDNPFDSLLAIYIVVNDPATGVVVKLAGHVVADQGTGRLTTTFDDQPQLPFSDFKLNFFQGAAAALRTPSTCGTYSTTSALTPWSGTPPATPKDTYAISQSPGGGSCPATAAAQSNAPSFDAGTVTPLAGTYSPFVLNLRRNDATQQFSTVTVSPPPGLVGKLAGTPACSNDALDAAKAKTGQQETANPSCPAASQVGTVDVAAGAGPAPYNAPGKVYMAGPYNGAPLSFAIVTPAVAGPFDLGTVVVRTAIHIDPTTARITATSDPIPSILQGIPLDVRSASIKLDKPNFTLNGTSCNPFAVTGQLVSTLNQVAPLSNPFQLGECTRLGFKPSLKLSLKGGTKRNGHPALTSVLTYPQGAYANLAKAAVTLPPTMQLDQSHIKAPCTRSQFAANACPDVAVIGSATATSPLLDYQLAGPVYLLTNGHALPDVMLDLKGPASQPVEFHVDGVVDTVDARLRTTFISVPDAPIAKAVIKLVGANKGLLVNNTNLCAQPDKATVLLDGQNNKTADSTPTVSVAGCHKAHKKHRHRHRAAH